MVRQFRDAPSPISGSAAEIAGLTAGLNGNGRGALEANPLGLRVTRRSQTLRFDELLAEAAIVSSIWYTDDTIGMIGAQQFAAMRDGGVSQHRPVPAAR